MIIFPVLFSSILIRSNSFEITEFDNVGELDWPDTETKHHFSIVI